MSKNKNLNSKKAMFRGTGRRKTSVAQVIMQQGDGKIWINNTPVHDFFPYATLVQDLEQPLTYTDTKGKFNIIIKVTGGGFSGQAGACRLAIVKALTKISNDYKAVLKPYGLLTRDSRIVERKKYGLKKARKAPQFSKR